MRVKLHPWSIFFWRCGLTYKGQAWTALYALVFYALVQACPGYLVCDSYRKACYRRVLVHNCMQTFCLYWISAVHCKCVNVSVYFSFYTFFSVPFCSNVPSTTATTNNYCNIIQTKHRTEQSHFHAMYCCMLSWQVSIAWWTCVYCLVDRCLLLSGRFLLLGGQVSIAWWTNIYCLADASTGFRYLQVTNQITKLWHAIL